MSSLQAITNSCNNTIALVTHHVVSIIKSKCCLSSYLCVAHVSKTSHSSSTGNFTTRAAHMRISSSCRPKPILLLHQLFYTSLICFLLQKKS